MYKEYDYIVIGAGIAGCSVAHFLSKYSNSVLLIDRNSDLAQGASGAAGAFLSPLLGKPNKFKDLVTKALKFSTNYYLKNIKEEITNCGVVRIPKNNEDKEKFKSYIPHMDFPFKQEEKGYFFDIGSHVNTYEVCSFLAKDVEKFFNYQVKKIEKDGEYWIIEKKYRAKNLILTTGVDTKLLEDEKYFNIRAVWGQRIDIYTTTCIDKNYHKECSVSFSKISSEKNKSLVSIGATHHRFSRDSDMYDVYNKNLSGNKDLLELYNINTGNSDTKKLLKLASDIIDLQNFEVCDVKIGARASSIDYFPMVGKMIDSKATIKKYPHLINGSHVKNDMLVKYDNLFVLNGVGGRGFVLSPYLAYNLVENIMKNNELEEDIITHRLFKRWVKKYKLNDN